MTTSRTRTDEGKFVAKRYDTKISTIEKTYGIDLNVNGNMKLGNYLKEKGYPSLSKLLKG